MECKTSTVSKQWQDIKEIYKQMETFHTGRREHLNGRVGEVCTLNVAILQLSGALQPDLSCSQMGQL